MLLSGHILENLHFLPIGVLLCQFLLGLLRFTIKVHLFVEQSGEKGLDFIGQHSFALAQLFGLELGREAARCGYLTKVRICRWKHQLTKLFEVDHVVKAAVVDLDDAVDVGGVRAQELLAHVVIELAAGDLSVLVDVE